MFWGGTDVPIEDSGEKASPVSLFFGGGERGRTQGGGSRASTGAAKPRHRGAVMCRIHSQQAQGTLWLTTAQPQLKGEGYANSSQDVHLSACFPTPDKLLSADAMDAGVLVT